MVHVCTTVSLTIEWFHHTTLALIFIYNVCDKAGICIVLITSASNPQFVDLSDTYVDLSDFHVDLSDIYVDLSDCMSSCQIYVDIYNIYTLFIYLCFWNTTPGNRRDRTCPLVFFYIIFSV